MTNKKVLGGMLVLVITFGLVFSGCATNITKSRGTTYNRRTLRLIGTPKYIVLGPVILEKKWFGILGLSTPFIGEIPGIDLYLYQNGGVTYADLLADARKQYEDADAVIDIRNEYSGSHYWVFFSKRKHIVSGIAIKYVQDEVTYPPPENKPKVRPFGFFQRDPD